MFVRDLILLGMGLFSTYILYLFTTCCMLPTLSADGTHGNRGWHDDGARSPWPRASINVLFGYA